MSEVKVQNGGQAESANTLIRAGARSKASQGKGWDKVLQLAKKLVNQRPKDHLSSLLAELREVDISRKDPGRYYEIKDPVRQAAQSILEAEGRSLGDRFYHPTVRNGKYTIDHISRIRYISQLIRPDTSAIVEVGSGWSSNLFQVYLAHGATRSSKLVYYAGEYTREGQICGKYLARQEEHLRYKAFSFDYRNPDVKFLGKQKGHILLFSSHSIEQVDVINPALFEQLKDMSNEITVVHFEPVGWQRVPDLMAKRESRDSKFFEKIGERALNGNVDSVVENAAWWSWRLDYNTNLVGIVKDLEDNGAIVMRRTEYDFDATANILNPATLIHYDYVR